MRTLKLTLLAERLAISRMNAGDAVPDWVRGAGFHSVTRTGEELSIVCAAERVPTGIHSEPGWRVLQDEGPLPFDATGILASLAAP